MNSVVSESYLKNPAKITPHLSLVVLVIDITHCRVATMCETSSFLLLRKEKYTEEKETHVSDCRFDQEIVKFVFLFHFISLSHEFFIGSTNTLCEACKKPRLLHDHLVRLLVLVDVVDVVEVLRGLEFGVAVGEIPVPPDLPVPDLFRQFLAPAEIVGDSVLLEAPRHFLFLLLKIPGVRFPGSPGV